LHKRLDILQDVQSKESADVFRTVRADRVVEEIPRPADPDRDFELKYTYIIQPLGLFQ
jgi:hypothetical protein